MNWTTITKDEEGVVIEHTLHFTRVLPNGVSLYESEELIAGIDIARPGVEPSAKVTVDRTGARLFIDTSDVAITFGYKSVDGLGQTNLRKIAGLTVNAGTYTATLKNGKVITARGIADFAKQLRKA